MTYVDMVFPFFLFIVGMSLPMAIRRRLSAGDSMWALGLHVAGRALALVVLGLILANRDKVDPRLTGLSADHWTLIALLGSILFWINYPKSIRFRIVFRGLKAAGLVVLVVMLAIFRRSLPNGHAAWLDLLERLPALHPYQAMAVGAGCMVHRIVGIKYSLLRSLGLDCLPGAVLHLAIQERRRRIHCLGGPDHFAGFPDR
jgi:hypothetical protein